MKLRILIAALLICSFAGQLHAQSNQYNFSLQEAIEYAYQNQNTIKNAGIDAEIAKNKVRETISIGLPQVNGTASVQRNIDIPTQLLPDFISPSLYGVLVEQGVRDGNGNPIQFPAGGFGYIPAQFGTKYTMSYGIEISQLIFDGNYLLGLRAASVYKDLSVRMLERTKIETSVSVTKAYYSVLVNQKRLELLDANVGQLKKTLDDTKAYYENGFAEKVDADRLSVLYNNLLTEKENVTRLITLNYQLLKFQMGMPVNADLSLKDNIEQIQLQSPGLENQAISPEARVEYQLIKTQLRLNELDYKRNIVTRAPSLVAFGNVARSYQNNEFSSLTSQFFPTTIVGLQLNVPLIGSGKKFYQTKQAKLTLEKTKNDLSNFENALNLEVNSTQTNYRNSITSLENQKKNMELAAEVLRVSKAKYNQGVGSSLEVTTAQTSLKEAETNYIGSLYDALIAKIELDKAYGNIK